MQSHKPGVIIHIIQYGNFIAHPKRWWHINLASCKKLFRQLRSTYSNFHFSPLFLSKGNRRSSKLILLFYLFSSTICKDWCLSLATSTWNKVKVQTNTNRDSFSWQKFWRHLHRKKFGSSPYILSKNMLESSALTLLYPLEKKMSFTQIWINILPSELKLTQTTYKQDVTLPAICSTQKWRLRILESQSIQFHKHATYFMHIKYPSSNSMSWAHHCRRENRNGTIS
jgi:hypothetical protein